MEKFKNVKNDLEKKKSTCFPLASSAVLFIYFFFSWCISSWNLHERERNTRANLNKRAVRSRESSASGFACNRMHQTASKLIINVQVHVQYQKLCPESVEKGSKRLESFFLPRNAHNFLSKGLKILRPMIYFVHFHRYVCYRVFYCNFLRKEISWKFVLIYESNVRVWNIGFEFRFDYWNRPRVKFSFLSYPWF